MVSYLYRREGEILPPSNEHPGGQSRRDSLSMTSMFGFGFGFARMGVRSVAIMAKRRWRVLTISISGLRLEEFRYQVLRNDGDLVGLSE